MGLSLVVVVTKWGCPQCGAVDSCGKGPCRRSAGRCYGLCCECVSIDNDRICGSLNDDGEKPCLKATCHHCGWSGEFPTAPEALAWFQAQDAIEATYRKAMADVIASGGRLQIGKAKVENVGDPMSGEVKIVVSWPLKLASDKR